MKNKNLLTWGTLMFAAIILGACTASAPSTEIPTAVPFTPTPQEGLTILAFGDSLTEGFGVDEDENYPSILERKLRADGYEVRVINGGISG